MKVTKALPTLLVVEGLLLTLLASQSAAPTFAQGKQTTVTSTTTAVTNPVTVATGTSTTTVSAGRTTGGDATTTGGTTSSTGSTGGISVPGVTTTTGGTTSSTSGNSINDSNPGTAWNIRQNYFLRNPSAAEAGPSPGGADVIQNKQSMGPGNITMGSATSPLYSWPVKVQSLPATVPSLRDTSIMQDLLPSTGYPASDTFKQLSDKLADNKYLEQKFDPEKQMWSSSAQAGMQATSAANSAANMTVNQAESAIDFTASYLTNFTAEANNQWQSLRNQLFIPMAILLLLPGAVLAQVKSIVSQGSPVLGDTNPFEGILRSIVAIFLIPGTFLVINYGIDVSNSITFTIADEYQRIFGTNMYQDANCAMQRAFPINPDSANDNAIMASSQPGTSTSSAPFAQYEALTLNLRQFDPCAGLNNTITPDERAQDAMKIGRAATNFANVGLSGMWNVMCAFQMAFLYYLWCMGPIAAALWVWPIGKLRAALPSWIEGVITLCFWSLFWNTTVLLMACFRGVGDSGTVIMSALTFLANICVKYAFDFSGLISQGAATGVQSATQSMMQGAASAASGGSSGAGSSAAGASGAAGAAGAGSAGTVSPSLGGLNSALTTGTSQNLASGVWGGSSSTSATAGLGPTVGGAQPGRSGANGGGGGIDPGAPPSFAGGNLSSFSGGYSGSPAGFGTVSSSGPISSSASISPNIGGITASSANSSTAAFNSSADGQSTTLNRAALDGMFGNNPASNSQTQAALTAAQQHDASKLQALAQSGMTQMGQQGGMDAQSQAMLQQMQAKGFSMDSSDTQALSSYLHGGSGVYFNSEGTAMNSNTGQPLSLSPGINDLATSGTGMYLGPNASMASSDTLPGGTTTYSGLSASGYNQFSAVDPTPTQGLSGLMSQEGLSGPMQFVDGNGQVLPPGTFNDNGAPVGAAPTSSVMAMNSMGEPIASYSPTTQEWSAPNTNGGVTLDQQTGQWTTASASGSAPVSYDQGQWYAQGTNGSVAYDAGSGGLVSTANGASVNYDASSQQYYASGTNNDVYYNQSAQQFEAVGSNAPVSYDSSSNNWYGAGTNEQVAYNTSNGSFEVAGSNAPVSYDNSSGNYYAAGGSVQYSQADGRFEASGSNAPVSYDSNSNNWYAAGSGGAISYDQSSNQFAMSSSGAPVSYDASSQSFYADQGQVRYDSQTQQFEAASSGVPVSYDGSSNQWYAAGSNNSVAYEGGNNFQTAGGAQLSYDQGQYYASNSNDSIGYDMSSQSFYSQGGAPVSYENGQYYASGTGGNVQFDGSQWVSHNQQSGGSVAYNYDSAQQQWSPQSQDGSVYSVSSANYGEPNPGSAASYAYDSGQGGSAAQYTYDQSQGGSAAQYMYDQSQGGSAAQYAYDQSQGGSAAQYMYDQSQGGSAAQYAYDQSQGGSAAQYMYDQSQGGSTNQYAYDPGISPVSYGHDPGAAGATNQYLDPNQGGPQYTYDPGSNPTSYGGYDPSQNPIPNMIQDAMNYTGGAAEQGYYNAAAPEQGYGQIYGQPEPGAAQDPGGVSGGEYYSSASEQHNHYQSEQSDSGGEYHQPAHSQDFGHSSQHEPEPSSPPVSHSAPQARHRPAPPSGRGFGAIIPPIGGARKAQGPTAKPPQQHQRSASEPPPEPPQHKSGALDMGAKQGGYKDQKRKNTDHNDMLREAWADYQEKHPDDEEPTQQT